VSALRMFDPVAMAVMSLGIVILATLAAGVLN
jgi:hypothetical protein